MIEVYLLLQANTFQCRIFRKIFYTQVKEGGNKRYRGDNIPIVVSLWVTYNCAWNKFIKISGTRSEIGPLHFVTVFVIGSVIDGKFV